MSPKKIGVLTFHRCINFGSYWQARCLVNGLQLRGHHAVLLDHESRRVNLSEWKCAFRPVLPTAVPESDYPLYREKIHRFFRAFSLLPLSPRFKMDEPAAMEDYDLVVVGSDEVWNLFHPWFGRCPLFYGDGIRSQHLVSYAASFGNYPAANGLPQEWADRLRNFDLVSVRDENSRAIVSNATGIEPELVLDPCLQFSITPDERENTRSGKPYIAVYGHNFTPAFAARIRRWAHAEKLPLVSIGYRNDWADEQYIVADPHDFAHFIARSQAVATNFFHGCVFALRNQKPFVCEATPYRSNKVRGLLATIGGEQHLLEGEAPDEAYNTLLSQPVSPQIFQKIDVLQQSSNAYLDRALALRKLQYA